LPEGTAGGAAGSGRRTEETDKKRGPGSGREREREREREWKTVLRVGKGDAKKGGKERRIRRVPVD